MAKVKIQGNASGTGVLTVTAPNTSTDRTITLPDSTGTILDENSSLPAANLTGTVADARISTLTASKLSGALPAISGAALTGITTGKVLQFVEGVVGSTTTISASGSHYTNNYVTITPSATSSKVLIMLDLGWDTEDGDNFNHTVRITDDDGSTFDWRSGTNNGYANNMAGGGLVSYYTTEHHTIVLSPATTSSKTFKVYVQKYNSTTIRYNGHSHTKIYALEIGA